MKATYTEVVLTQSDQSPVYGTHRIIIRIDDQAGGPYLVVRGYNADPQVGETEHDFFLQTEEEIDQFAEACKMMLRQVKESDAMEGSE